MTGRLEEGERGGGRWGGGGGRAGEGRNKEVALFVKAKVVHTAKGERPALSFPPTSHLPPPTTHLPSDDLRHDLGSPRLNSPPPPHFKVNLGLPLIGGGGKRRRRRRRGLNTPLCK